MQLFLIFSLESNDSTSPALGVENSKVKISGNTSSKSGNKGV